MRSRPVLVASVGAAVVFASAALLLFGFTPATELDWLSLVFVLVAELVAFGIATMLAAIGKRLHHTLLPASVGAALVVYLLAAVGAALVFRFVPLLRRGAGVLIALQIALLAALVVVLLLALHFSLRAAEKEGATLRTLAGLRDVAARLEVLALQVDAPYQAPLRRAADSLRGTDLATEAPDDWQLEKHLQALEELYRGDTYTEAEAAPLVDQIEKLAHQRRIQLAAQKHGGF